MDIRLLLNNNPTFLREDDVQKAKAEEMPYIINHISTGYVKTLRHLIKRNEVKEPLTYLSIERLELVIEALNMNLTNSSYLKPVNYNNSYKCVCLQSWVMLGSATEVILQMFLAVYFRDYEKAGLHKWEEFEETQVRNEIINKLEELQDKKMLSLENTQKLKKYIIKELKSHTKIPSVDWVKLDELISFFTSEEIIDGSLIPNLRIIQQNRNCIHAFSQRTIDESGLLDALKGFCFLILQLEMQLPQID